MSNSTSNKKELVGTIRSGLQGFATYSYVHQSQVANAFGLHPTDMHALHVLDQSGTTTAGELSKELNLTSGATTAVIDRLVAVGFARRDADKIDRRRVYVRLNPEEIATLKAQYQTVDKHVTQALSKYSAEELEVLVDFLHQLSKPAGY